MKCDECGAQIGQERHHPECPDDPDNQPQRVNDQPQRVNWETHPIIIDVCPCGSAQVARLMPDWQRQVDGGASVPIVGCGAPWHYVNLDRGGKPA